MQILFRQSVLKKTYIISKSFIHLLKNMLSQRYLFVQLSQI